MNYYTIEKGHAAPKTTGKRNSHVSHIMEIGDSILIPIGVSANAFYGRRDGKKFTMKREAGGNRIWRIA